MTTAVLRERVDVGIPHAQFEKGEVLSEKPRQRSLRGRRIPLLFAAAAVCAVAAFRAAAVPSETTLAVPLIDTNVPLYVLVDVPELITSPLGTFIIVR